MQVEDEILKERLERFWMAYALESYWYIQCKHAPKKLIIVKQLQDLQNGWWKKGNSETRRMEVDLICERVEKLYHEASRERYQGDLCRTLVMNIQTHLRWYQRRDSMGLHQKTEYGKRNFESCIDDSDLISHPRHGWAIYQDVDHFWNLWGSSSPIEARIGFGVDSSASVSYDSSSNITLAFERKLTLMEVFQQLI